MEREKIRPRTDIRVGDLIERGLSKKTKLTLIVVDVQDNWVDFFETIGSGTMLECIDFSMREYQVFTYEGHEFVKKLT